MPTTTITQHHFQDGELKLYKISCDKISWYDVKLHGTNHENRENYVPQKFPGIQ